MAPPQRCVSLLLVILLVITPHLTNSLSYFSLQTLNSLSHSLLLRISTLRSTRGDKTGSDRAKFIANKLDRVGFRSVVSLGWDYLRNYAWRDTASFEVFGAVKDLNDLIEALGSQNDGIWVRRTNYRDALRAANSLFRRLLKVFHHSGPLRKLVETMQKEVVEGDLLRDCLELGSNDLNGLLQIMKDVALQFSSSSDRSDL